MAHISSENSTDTPLAGDGVFLGEYVDVLSFATVSVLVHSDIGSSDDGLQIEWSTDKTVVDDRQSFDYVGTTAALGLVVMATVRARYMRIRYVNSSLDQAFFRLQVLLHDKTPSASIGYLGQPVSVNEDTLLVKAVLAARDINTGTNVVLPFASADPFLIVEHPPNRSTLIERTISQSTNSQQLDFFGLFGGTRRVMSILNNSKDPLFIRFGASASTSSFSVKLPADALYETPLTWGLYSGTVHGVWDKAGTGTAQTVEFF